MKLVVFGLTVSSSWGNGHATLWRGLCRSLARAGHRVVFYERDVPWYAEHRDLHGLPGGELVLYPHWDEVRQRARQDVADADAAIVTSYCPDALAATDLVLAAPRARRVFYDLDSGVTLARLQAGEPVEYVGPAGLGGFDLVLTYTGGRTANELRTKLGARRVAPLYGSVDPDAHRPQPPQDSFCGRLSYLGTWAEDRQQALRALFLEPARHLPDERFVLGGAQYPADFPWAPNVFYVRHVPPPAHPAFYASSALTLNVTRAAMAQVGFCPSGRLFEAAACGTPVLSDWFEGLECFFAPEREIFVARHTDDALRVLRLPSEELARVGRAARERTLDEHSSEVRARELVRHLEQSSRPPQRT